MNVTPLQVNMFGFSLTKLVFTIVAVVVVWQGFKWFARRSEIEANSGGNNKKAEKKDNKANVEEMVKCDTCGTFAAPGSKSCGRDDCPFPG